MSYMMLLKSISLLRESSLPDDHEPFGHFIIKCSGLYHIAQKDSVELCITLDGAKLCDGISHLAAYVEITEQRQLLNSGIVHFLDGRIFKCARQKLLLGSQILTRKRY